MSEELYDVIIIGGGPAGLSAAQYASRSKLRTVVLDKSPTAGALAFTSKIVNYPGQTAPMSGTELLNIFRKQALDFGAEYVETQVVGVSLEAEVKDVIAMDKIYKGKVVVIATGSMGRKPSIKGEAELLGRGVSYCAICDAAFYKGRTVCVVGDSEEAIKEADLLTRFAETVYLIAPAKEIKGEHPALDSGKIKVLTNHKVLSIEGEDGVTGIKVLNSETSEETEMPMDGVFVYLHGSQPIVDFLNFSVDLSDEKCVLANKMMETSIPGVFTAGDVSCTEVRQVVVAAANGCLAALSAEKYIHHKKRRKLDWG
ncbi:MAG: FAD-dependent oxidoreductase [Thermodesulfovibrionia bacterium]|nr:FAD-dependent oxidoreductase [Thermodesulfovibrionia bacterium]